ncbi:MAG: ubiquinone anaerobic biosynthesis accessory factor UbiT [Acidiferrobacter sp.]
MPSVAHTAARILPAPILTMAAVVVANVILAGDLALCDLDGQRVCLCLTDAARELGFVIRHGRLWPAPPAPWQVRISADGGSFWALFRQRVDADALFFERRLTVEGDTALGLALRHALDSGLYRHRKRLRALRAGGHR